MSQGKKAISRWIFDGTLRNAPREWQTAEALATFDREAVQANISIDNFTFVNEEAIQIMNHISNGMLSGVGIFEGIPYKIELYNKNGQTVVFDGMINLADGIEINEFKKEVKVKLKVRDELLSLEDKLASLSFGYLESLGLFNSGSYTEVDYIVQKKNNIVEIIILAITIYLMTKELIDTLIRLVKDIVAGLSETAGGGPFGWIGAILWFLAVIILNILYAALLLVALLEMSETLISQIIPIKRQAKTITFRAAMETVCSHLGYGFVTNIPDIDSVVYLPSNYTFDTTNSWGVIDFFKSNAKGIPSTSDYGYNCADFFEIAKKLFNGKYAVINGDVVFHNVDDLYWVQTSSFQMPSVREKVKSYNTDELKANRFLTFDVDFVDEWTIDDYQGTSYEVITTPNISNDASLSNIKGLDEIRFAGCLGSRKESISGFESFLTDFCEVIDDISNFLGGGTNYVQMVGISIGVMRITTNNWTKPKIIKIDGARKLVTRDSWSAKYIYETYYMGRSFVGTVNGLQNYGQKEIYRNVRIPFGLDNFISMINNSCFGLPDGSTGKVMSCKYRFDADYAYIDYFLRKPYTVNLAETMVEPTNQ